MATRRWGRKIDIGYDAPGAASGAVAVIPRERRLARPLERLRPQISRSGYTSEIDIAGGHKPDTWQSTGGNPFDGTLAALSPEDVRCLIQRLEKSVGAQGARKAARDQHAKRQPIACGVQLISGHSCSYACRYCYIQDWYPFVEPTPTEMSGSEVLLSLLYNPNWIPSRDFIILGDVCDPFHPNLEVRSMEYIKSAAVLGSPIQFSTKSAINKATCDQLAEWSVTYQCPINALVTITTMKHVGYLEPLAPSVEARLDTIRNLSAAGLSVFLFMRPLLPGSCDYEDILKAAKAAGAEGVVVGSLRVSRKIYRRLKQSKTVDMEAIDSQLHSAGQLADHLTENQVDLQDEGLRQAVSACAENLNMVVVRRACCANAVGSQMPCRKPKCLARSLIPW